MKGGSGPRCFLFNVRQNAEERGRLDALSVKFGLDHADVIRLLVKAAFDRLTPDEQTATSGRPEPKRWYGPRPARKKDEEP